MIIQSLLCHKTTFTNAAFERLFSYSLCRFKLGFFHAPNLIFHLHETLVMFLYNFFGLLHLALVCNFLIHLLKYSKQLYQLRGVSEGEGRGGNSPPPTFWQNRRRCQWWRHAALLLVLLLAPPLLGSHLRPWF